MSERRRYQPWGLPGLGSAAAAREPAALLRGEEPVLPFGAGRSYGDSCTVAGGWLLDGRDGARVRAFDRESGRVTADAGVSLAALIAAVAPSHMPEVLPGTQFATLGGAIANDVHGKNHHRRGSFGAAVEAITLHRSDHKGALRLSRGDPLFAATIGGMGLTGRISSATVRVMAVPGQGVAERASRFSCLEEYFERAGAADAAHEYAVAWIDSLATGRATGRGHLIVGDHVAGADQPARGALARVPFTPPISALNGLSLRAFNALYLRSVSAAGRARTVPFDAFFFPLDRVLEWNRLYGPRGLHQHQSVIPLEAAPRVVPALLRAGQKHGQASFLTVLKRFGETRSPAVMSFARPGYTLTLDVPDRGAKTLALLGELDAITLDAGGAINPYKDKRMAAATFKHSFPRWGEVEALRDPAIVSDFWRRTALALPQTKSVAA
ncbi:MAG: FAD-binding oxidoreductase [Pseudomonadota bacterium]